MNKVRHKMLKAVIVSVGTVVTMAAVASGAAAVTHPSSARSIATAGTQTSAMAPAIAGTPLAEEHYFLAYIAKNGTDDILVTTGTAHTNGSVTWSAPTNTGQKSKTTPAISAYFFPTFIVMVYVADNSSNNLLSTTSTNGTTWTPSKKVGNQSSALAPSLAACSGCGTGGDVELAYVANNSSRHLLVSTGTFNLEETAVTWSSGIEVGGQSSKDSPSISSFGDETEFVLAYVANNSSDDLIVTTSSNGATWTPDATVGAQSSKTGPSVSEWLGNDGSTDQDTITYVANNSTNDLIATTSTNDGQQSALAPALPNVSLAPFLAMTYVANNSSEDLLLTTSANGGASWNPNTKVGNGRRAARF
jgi:hypothetical protein